MRIDADELNAGPCQWHRDSPGPDAQVENRRGGLPCPAQPGFRVADIRQLGVEFGEALVWIVRIVDDEAGRAYTGKTPCLRLTRGRVRLEYRAKRAASSPRKSEGATTASMTRLEASLYKSISPRYSSCSCCT